MLLWSSRVAGVLIASVCIVGACGRPLTSAGRPSENVVAEVMHGMALERGEPRLPLVALMLGTGDVWAIDVEQGTELWRRPIRAFAEPAVHGRHAAIPVRGQEILTIDAYDGTSKWQVEVPGQALTGVAIDGESVVVTTLSDRSRFRSEVTGLSLLDGQRRWSRPSRELMGSPAVVAGTAYLPLGTTLLALRARSGKFLGRVPTKSPLPLERIEHYGSTLLATNPEGFIDLYGGGNQFYPVGRGAVAPFDELSGFASWVGRNDGVAFRVFAGVNPGSPRDALLMVRRVLVAIRLDGLGRPVAVRWVHSQPEPIEFVAVGCVAEHIVVAREDGALLRFDPATGRREAGLVVSGAIEGAAFVGGTRMEGFPRQAGRPERTTLTQILLLLDEPDPRLLPAQLLFLDILWRSPNPKRRFFVADRAAGPSGPLQARAQGLVESMSWGRGDDASVAAMVERFTYPGASARDDFIALVQSVPEAGGPRALMQMLEALDDVGTPAGALEAVMIAVRRMDDPRAVPAVSAFVRRYCKDPDVVGESLAMFVGLEFLLSQASEPRPARRPKPAQALALDTLRKVHATEFTDPRLLHFLSERFR